MKIKYLLSFAVLALLLSCSPNSDSGTDSSTPTNYFPLAVNNFWNYRVVANSTTQTDNLYISEEVSLNSKVYKKFKTTNTPVNGFFSNSLNNNALRIDGSKVLLTGTLDFNNFGISLPIQFNFSVEDYVIFQENATNNQLIGSLSGTINQTVQNYPLVINYTLKSTALESLPTYTSPDGHVYTDVKKVKTVLNANINLTVPGTIVTMTVMQPQDVVTSEQYYSKNIGMVYNKTTINYQLSPPAGITLPIPSSGNQIQEEFLQNYDVTH